MIYFDNNATTQVAPEVFAAMKPFLTDFYGNPSSAYNFGRDARAAIEDARESVAELLGARNSNEIVFTSGGTESDNWAILGALESNPEKKHVITTNVEHEAVRKLCEKLEKKGFEITRLEVDENGYITATYDTGFTRRLYQIPLVDVPNPNGLIALNNQTYQISPSSGSFFLWDAGDGPTGAVVGYAREGSTTDVAAELTALIQTQRAYSSNAKVIQTVDEMLQETTNIKR